MKIKKEKPSFSDVEESDSEPESVRTIPQVNIKVEPNQSPDADKGGRIGEKYPLDNEPEYDDDEESNRRLLEKVLEQIGFPGQVELKLKQYFKEFPLIRPAPIGRRSTEIDLANPDEETWIIQCPATIDVHKELLKKKLNLTASEAKIKHCSVPLEARVVRNSDEQAIGLMCGTRIKSFVPTGFVRISETVPAVVKAELSPSVLDSNHIEVPFPEEIRQRHPLLGYAFEPLVTISDSVRKRLSRARKQANLFYTSSPAAVASKSTSNSKKAKLERSVVTVKIEADNQTDALEKSPVKRASKKRKQPNEEEPASASATPRKMIKLEPESPQKKPKRRLETELSSTIIDKKKAPEDDISWLLSI